VILRIAKLPRYPLALQRTLRAAERSIGSGSRSMVQSVASSFAGL